MTIAGYVPNSFVDYPGKIAALVFAPGCNMNCWYCHNHHLLTRDAERVIYNPRTILSDLERKQGFLDAVVLTGGEPTLQIGLSDFAREVKQLGYLVKLDTNGTHPDIVRAMLAEGLLDYIAMDIKAPFEKYESVCRRAVDIEKIKESIELLRSSGIDYEFRTTFSPDLTAEDITAIASCLAGANRYTLQQYRETERTHAQKPHPPEYVKACAAQIASQFGAFRVLGL